jgi:glucose-6-phosphate 1-dehydrogenase
MLGPCQLGRLVRCHKPKQAAFAVCYAAYLSPVCRFLPENLSILGYARSKLSKKDLQEKVKPNLKGDDDKINEFLDKLDYEAGPYDKPEGYQKVGSAHSSA